MKPQQIKAIYTHPNFIQYKINFPSTKSVQDFLNFLKFLDTFKHSQN